MGLGVKFGLVVLGLGKDGLGMTWVFGFNYINNKHINNININNHTCK